MRKHRIIKLYYKFHLIQIQVIFARCFRHIKGAASCACAIAIRYGTTTIVFDNCIHVKNNVSRNNRKQSKKNKSVFRVFASTYRMKRNNLSGMKVKKRRGTNQYRVYVLYLFYLDILIFCVYVE